MRKRPVQQDIRPAPDSELRGQLPGLEAAVVLEVVQRFIEVEHCAGQRSDQSRCRRVQPSQTPLTFVAVGNDTVHRSYGANEEQDPEGKGQGGYEGGGCLPGDGSASGFSIEWVCGASEVMPSSLATTALAPNPPAQLVLEQPLMPPLPPQRRHTPKLILLRLAFLRRGIGSRRWSSEPNRLCPGERHGVDE